MRAEIVTEEQRVPLVRAAFDADVDVGSPFAVGLCEESLRPLLRRTVVAGRAVIDGDPFTGPETRRCERVGGTEIGDGDLHVDDVLRRQSRDGGRTDVVDAQGRGAERVANPLCDGKECVRPALGVRSDRSAAHAEKVQRPRRRGRFVKARRSG